MRVPDVNRRRPAFGDRILDRHWGHGVRRIKRQGGMLNTLQHRSAKLQIIVTPRRKVGSEQRSCQAENEQSSKAKSKSPHLSFRTNSTDQNPWFEDGFNIREMAEPNNQHISADQ